MPDRVRQRILRWADRDHQTGCLISRYSTGSHGYAQIGWTENGRKVVTTAHRALWIAERGPIPVGMTVDHQKCRNQRCVEIAHFRLLPNLENARRTLGRDWPLGVCVNGHSSSFWRPKSQRRKKGYCSACRQEARAMA